VHVLFLDDSCGARAPLAEAIFRHLAPEHDATGAGWAPSHVRPDVRAVLDEEGIPPEGLRARGLPSVPWDEIDVVVRLVPDEGRLRVPSGARELTWLLPDPLAAPPAERREAFRAARDELTRRLKLLLKESR
jgi:protein-tyrosine-phosphatase